MLIKQVALLRILIVIVLQYELTNSCKHVAAILYRFYDQIIPKIISKEDNEKLAQIMFNIID